MTPLAFSVLMFIMRARRSAPESNQCHVAACLSFKAAERGAAHAKDAYRRTQEAAGETTKVMEQTYSAASKGAADFNLHLLDITLDEVLPPARPR